MFFTREKNYTTLTKNTRKQFLKNTVPVTIGAAIGLTTVGALANNTPGSSGTKMKIVVLGAHPDDH